MPKKFRANSVDYKLREQGGYFSLPQNAVISACLNAFAIMIRNNNHFTIFFKFHVATFLAL